MQMNPHIVLVTPLSLFRYHYHLRLPSVFIKFYVYLWFLPSVILVGRSEYNSNMRLRRCDAVLLLYCLLTVRRNILPSDSSQEHTVFWQFAGTYCLHLHQLRRLNGLGRLDKGATFLQNVTMYATNPATRFHILEDLNSRSAMFVNP